MKALIVLSLALTAPAALAAKVTAVPNGPCEIETQEGYVAYEGTEDVYVCQNGVWTYFYSRAAKGSKLAGN